MKKFFCISFVFLILLSAFGCSYTSVDVGNFEYEPEEKTEIYSFDGKLIAELYNENRTYVSIEDIPNNLMDAIISVEDERFYNHNGYDIIGIFRATFTNIKNRNVTEGASTITQQLARNLFDEISTEQTVSRKIKEIFTARQLEEKYSKEKIIEMYLNEIYLGSGTFGVQEASKHYLGKDVSELSLAECALIAGLPQAPSAYAPDENFDLAKKRQELVLDRMVSNQYITDLEADEAKDEKINIIKQEKEIKSSNGKSYDAFVNRVVNEYCEYLQKQNPDKDIDRDVALGVLKNGGLKITTTLNSEMQEIAIQSLSEGIKSYGIESDATGALVTVNSKTGQVLAYYGGNTEFTIASLAVK